MAEQHYTTIDCMRMVMAVLVIGIHTEPFGFNIWLDRGFGILTRVCVPFFFVTGAYFYWLKEKGAISYIKRLLRLYAVWSLIYLPFDIKELSRLSFVKILYRFFWAGNEHALWYLWGSIVGFIITYLLLKVFRPKTVMIIAAVFLVAGCAKSTWSPLVEHLFSVRISDWLGSRNGLFYAFPYTALGMIISKSSGRGKEKSLSYIMAGLALSLTALLFESFIFVLYFHTNSTILWLSVFPYAYFVFLLCINTSIHVHKSKALFLRRLSMLTYAGQFLFIPYFTRYMSTYALFAVVSISTCMFGCIVLYLSRIRFLGWLKCLY